MDHRYVLDYIREHGADSETLSNIYVVDEHGVLIDLRIRVFLLAPLYESVLDVMDRQFVALKATDDQETAVAGFRREDRTALPVTDTTGVLIGIVTIDEVAMATQPAIRKALEEESRSEMHFAG
ncbi:MAG: CBS domain-containing protein [Acidobacteriota bacterium]